MLRHPPVPPARPAPVEKLLPDSTDNDKLCGLTREQELCLRADPATAKIHQPSWGEGPERDDRLPSLTQPTRNGGPTRKPSRSLSQSDAGGTGAGVQRHPPHGLTNSSPGGTEEPLQAAPGVSGSCQAHQLRGRLASRTLARVPSLSAFAGLGSCPVGHPPPAHGLMFKARAGVCAVLGSGAQSRPLDLGVPGGLWPGQRPTSNTGCVPAHQAAPQAASGAC